MIVVCGALLFVNVPIRMANVGSQPNKAIVNARTLQIRMNAFNVSALPCNLFK